MRSSSIPHAALFTGGRGSPLWSLELARTLVETGVVEVRDGSLHLLTDIETAEFPSTVEQLITARLDQLPAAEGLIVKVRARGCWSPQRRPGGARWCISPPMHPYTSHT